jgi:mono/diheme cytochrome c family protein
MPSSSLVLAFAAVLGGLVLGACSDATPSAAPPDGAALFRENCVQCHAPDAGGTGSGPTLHGKQQFWTRAKLAAYFLDPQSVIRGDARLEAQAGRYLLSMVKFVGLSPEQRLALADYVLGLP